MTDYQHSINSMLAKTITLKAYEFLAGEYPEASGDMSPRQVLAFEKAVLDMVNTWVNNNVEEDA